MMELPEFLRRKPKTPLLEPPKYDHNTHSSEAASTAEGRTMSRTPIERTEDATLSSLHSANEVRSVRVNDRTILGVPVPEPFPEQKSLQQAPVASQEVVEPDPLKTLATGLVMTDIIADVYELGTETES